MSGLSSSDSTMSGDYLTYNNLPTFANNRKVSSLQSENSFYNISNPTPISNKTELPFEKSRNLIKSRIPSKFFDSNSKTKRQSSSLFGSRVWSSNLDKRIYSDANNMDYIHNNNNTKHNTNDNDTNTTEQLLTLSSKIGSLLYIIFSKSCLWIIWCLNIIFSFLLDKIKSIPEPDIEALKATTNNNNIMDAESTPRFKGSIFNPNNLPKNDMRKKTLSNPLFQQKLNSIKNNLNGKIKQEKESLNRENDAEKDSTDSLEEIVFKNIPDIKYGTHFFHTTDKKTSKLNLESCYLKTAMNTHLINFEDGKLNNETNRPTDIKGNLMSFYNSNVDDRLPYNNKIIKPSFNRSSTRWSDFEWKKDDNVDYLNDLESTKLFKEYQNIVAERRSIQQLKHLSTLKERGLGIRPLKPEQLEEVEKIWMNQPGGILINKYGIRITSMDILTLSDRHWLNDNIIDFYLQLIKDYVNTRGISKIHVFSTFFYTTLQSKGYTGVKKWAKRAKVDVSEMDYIFVPCNLHQSHWALAVIDNVNQNFSYIDSLNGDGSDILAILLDYMTQETIKNHGDTMNGKDYSTYFINGQAECPSQQNGYDCGVFTCTAVDCIARNRDLDYSQADMPNLRRRMSWEILKGKLLNH